MRKHYLLLMSLLFPLATMMFSGNAYAQTDEEYEAALASITDGGTYYITTDVEGLKYYMTNGGYLIASREEASMFTFNKKTGGSYKTYGFQLYSGGSYFSNPVNSSYTDDVITDDHINTSTRGDATWETQVFFLKDGLYAIRACNCSYAESSWNHVGSSFWTAIGDVASYDYTPQYIWSLEAPEDKDKIITVLQNIFTTYEEQVWDYGDGETMNIGTGFGQRSDVDTWTKFWTLLQYVNDTLDKMLDPKSDYFSSPDAITLEQANQYRADADSMYQVILDSEVPYTVEDGYYRIYAHNRYKSTFDESGFVDKAIAASFDKDHENKIVFSTLQKERANFLWKFTKSESGDSILLQNAGMGTYISLASSIKEGKLVTTPDVSQAGYVMFDYAYDGPQYVEPDGIGDDKDIFCIRFTQDPRAGERYFHQNGHSSVRDDSSPWGNYGVDTGKEQEMGFWRRTWDYDNTRSDFNASEWFLEFVPAEEAEEIIANFEAYKNHDVLVVMNNELRAKVLETLTLAKDVIKTKLITSADQMSSPYSHNDQAGNGRDGGDLSAGVLIDGDPSTYWHSAWQNSPEGQHYIELSGMEYMIGDCEFYLQERAGAANDRPKQFRIVGSDNLKNPDEDWEEIAIIDIPNFAAGAESTVPFYVETAYPYVRVIGTDCDPSYRTFWHAAELQISTVRDNPNSQFALLGEVAEELESIYEANAATPDEDITPDMYQALLEAYKTFLSSGLVDPAELRAALAAYAKVTEAVVEGTNPGQWKDTQVAKDYDDLYAEVEAYDKAGKYNAAQNHKYAVMLKAMKKSVMEQANVIETDKWYRIMYPTEEMYDEYGFSKDGGDKTSLIEEQGTLFGTFVTIGKEVSEETTDLNEQGEEVTVTVNHIETLDAEDIRESNRMFFMGEDEIDYEDASEFRFVEREADAADYTSLFSEVKENMSMALDMSTTYTRGEALITDPKQLSSNANDKSEGLHIENLIDGNINTYWHSDYHKEFLEPGYIQVALNEPVSGLIQIDVTRRQNATNGHIVRMYIQGSNDAETWTNVGYIETPFTNQNESVTSQPVDLDGTYSYLRFTMTYRYGTDAGGNMEFDPFAKITSADEYNTLWTYFHAAEFQIYPVTLDKELDANGKALEQAFVTANKVILVDATAEDLAAAAQGYKAFKDEFNAQEGKAVLPNGADKAPSTYAIQNKATGLFINAKGGNSNDIYLKTIPTFFTYSAPGYQRSFLHGQNIDGTNCTYLHAGESNRRLCTWNANTPGSNSGLVICEVEEEYEAPAEFTYYKDVKPGRIIDWCNSVSITPVDAPEEAVAYAAVGQYTEEEDGAIFLALKALETIEAGQPALFIYGDTLDYDAEDDYVEPIKFSIPGDAEIVVKGAMTNGLIGTLVTTPLDPCLIYFDGNHAACPTEDQSLAVTPCSAILDLDNCPQVDPNGEYDFSICLGQAGTDAADGVKNIPTAIEKISQPGAVYSMDGKLLRTGATLNSLKSMGKGMYILNGVKVVVK